MPRYPHLTRRTVLAAALTSGVSALTACSSDEKKTASTPSASGASTPSSASAAAGGVVLNPVDGFKTTPDWVSTNVPELAGWLPDPGACGTWYDGHAWVIVTQEGKSRVLAIDPAAKTAILSDDLPGAAKHMKTGATPSPWATITTPSKALILSTDAGLVSVSLDGSKVVTALMPKNPAVSGANEPVWTGEGIVVVQKNQTQAATGDMGDAGNTAPPSYYLDAAAKKWVAMLPKHNGTIVGVTARDGKTVPIELVGADLWVGDQSFKTGFSKPQGVASAAGPLPFRSFIWSADGVLLMSVRTAEDGVAFVRYDQSGKPMEGKDGIGTTWKPKVGDAVLLPGGNVYAPAAGMLMGGIHLAQGSYDWELLNATVAPDGTLYANADPSPTSGVLPTSGSYVSKTGELEAKQHTDKTTPVVVTPDGAGMFTSGPSWVLAAKA